MIRLAATSLRHRTSAFVATFVSIWLGASILMGFGSLLDTLGDPSTTSDDESTMLTMVSVVGGWSLLIVLFAVASTLGLSIRQRSGEMTLLKSVGATPRQVRRLVVGETAVIATVASLAAIVPGMAIGHVVFDMLQDTDQISAGVDHRFGFLAFALGAGVTTAASLLAARLAVRRTAKASVRDAAHDAAVGPQRMSWKRRIAAGFFILIGLENGLLTALMFTDEDGSDAMQTGGPAAIYVAIGLALMAPALVRLGSRVIGRPLQRFGASGYLAVENARQQSHRLASALMPIILFTTISTATIYMQIVENGFLADAGLVKTNDQKGIETLNWVVIGMIGLFAAIMLVNTLIASTSDRRREFAQQRLAGATPPDVLKMVTLEAVTVLCTGVAVGAVASLVAVVPYTIHRTSSAIPDASALPFVGIVAAATVLALGASRGAARRSIEEPAVEAIAA